MATPEPFRRQEKIEFHVELVYCTIYFEDCETIDCGRRIEARMEVLTIIFIPSLRVKKRKQFEAVSDHSIILYPLRH